MKLLNHTKSALVLFAGIQMALPVMAKTTLIKQCVTDLKNLDNGSVVTSDLQIVDKDGVISSIVKQTQQGYTSSYEDIAIISSDVVREGLTTESDPDTLNPAERLIVHAMTLTEDPVFGGEYSSGIDLTQVRSATLFQVGQSGNMGSSTIVEAKDKNGAILGSFLGGFLVAPCK